MHVLQERYILIDYLFSNPQFLFTIDKSVVIIISALIFAGNARSCLREGEHSPDQHSCCQGLARCPKTGLCLGQDGKYFKIYLVDGLATRNMEKTKNVSYSYRFSTISS